MFRKSDDLTAGELVRLAFPAGCEILSGAAGRARTVKWVALAGEGVPPAADDLVLLPARPDPAMLAGWQSAGIAGVGFQSRRAPLIGPDVSSPWPDDLLVVALPPDVSLRELQQSALRLLIDRETYLATRGAQVHRTLAGFSLEGGGLKAMAHAMLDMTGSSVLVHDKRLNPLAQAVSPALAQVWPEIQTYLSSPNHLPADLRDRKRASGLQTQSLPGGLARVICPVVVKGVARGYLSIVGLAGDLDALDELVAEQGAAACALEMARAKAVSETTKRLRGDFVDAVLSGSLTETEAEAWANRVGHEVDRPHAVITWAWGPGVSPSLRRLETAANGEVTRMDLAPSVLVCPRGELIVAVCEESGLRRADTALQLARAVLAAIGNEFPESRVFAGVGRPAAEMHGWRASFREAEQALAIARRLESAPPLYFSDLSVYRLLLQLEGHPELATFCQDVLGPLLNYEGSADLLATLTAFFEHHGNLSRTAEALYVHRNTLLYRMQRIADLGLDLDNPEIRLAVQLALKALRLLKPIDRKSG